MGKNTIAFILPGLGSGGAERVVTILANKFSENYRIVIISLYKTYPFYPLNSNIKLLYCVEAAPNSKNLFQAILSNFKLLKRISHFIRKENVKLSLGFLTSANVLAVLASKQNNIPVIICERNNPFLSKAPLFWKLLRKFTYPKANYLVVQTQVIMSYYSDLVKAENLILLSNPISPNLTATKNQRLDKKKIILNVGSFTEQKGQQLLIKAFAGIKNEGWQLHLVGKGHREKEYQELISSLNITDQVKLLPPTKEIETHYKRASIFAFVSKYEGFPNALIEAMHFGIACISTNCPTGPSELIKNNENGFLVPMNDQNCLQEHLIKLMGDESLRRHFGKNAEESVKQFEAVKVAGQWQNLLEKALR